MHIEMLILMGYKGTGTPSIAQINLGLVFIKLGLHPQSHLLVLLDSGCSLEAAAVEFLRFLSYHRTNSE